MVDNRPSWDEYFMNIVKVVSKRGTCDRGYPACVMVRDHQILSTGYAGAPSGLKHCSEVGHELHEVIHNDGTVSKHCIRTVHAEQNAIVQAAKNGISLNGATVYVNMEPCYVCAKMLINVGVVKIISAKKYHGAKRSREIFKEAGIEFIVLKNEEEVYSDK